MKQFNPFVFDKTTYKRELTQYRTFLKTKSNVDSKFIIILTFDELLQMLETPYH